MAAVFVLGLVLQLHSAAVFTLLHISADLSLPSAALAGLKRFSHLNSSNEGDKFSIFAIDACTPIVREIMFIADIRLLCALIANGLLKSLCCRHLGKDRGAAYKLCRVHDDIKAYEGS